MTKGTLVAPSEFVEHFRSHDFEISGLLGWCYAMGWDIHTINEDLSGYDMFLTNFSSTESEYASVIRQIVPDATIIACFDYGFDVVGQYFVDLSRIKTVMDRCDILFSVSQNQRDWVKGMFPDRDIHYIPH